MSVAYVVRMHFRRAVRLSFRGEYRFEIELEEDVFGILDLDETTRHPQFEALRPLEVFQAAAIDDAGMIVWPWGIALEPATLFECLRHHMFEIGVELTMSWNRWRCTDGGTRAIAAIQLGDSTDDSWLRGRHTQSLRR